MNEKRCGNCAHWHKVNVPRSKRDIYKNGRCGLGYRDANDIPTCLVYKDKDEKAPVTIKAEQDDPVKEAAAITGCKVGRFTSNPWKEWQKR